MVLVPKCPSTNWSSSSPLAASAFSTASTLSLLPGVRAVSGLRGSICAAFSTASMLTSGNAAACAGVATDREAATAAANAMIFVNNYCPHGGVGWFLTAPSEAVAPSHGKDTEVVVFG